MLPGVAGLEELKNVQVDDRQLDRIEAMIFSMTPQERRRPIASTAAGGSASPRQRYVGAGCEPAAQAVSRDAEDA